MRSKKHNNGDVAIRLTHAERVNTRIAVQLEIDQQFRLIRNKPEYARQTKEVARCLISVWEELVKYENLDSGYLAEVRRNWINPL